MKQKKSYKSRSKKGSLEISITAVVVLIIAIVMLGLALTFIRTFFGGTVEELGEVTERLDEQTRTDLLASPQQVTFLSSRLKVEGREKELSYAIRNVRQNDIEFSIDTKCFDAIGSDAIISTLESDPETFVRFATFKKTRIEGGKSDVLPLKVTMTAAAPTTIYKCEMIVEIQKEFDRATGDVLNTPTDPTEQKYARKLFEVEYSK